MVKILNYYKMPPNFLITAQVIKKLCQYASFCSHKTSIYPQNCQNICQYLWKKFVGGIIPFRQTQQLAKTD